VTASFKSQGRDIPVEILPGSGAGRRPAVVVVHGTRGTNAPFGALVRGFAIKLSPDGCTALIPQYFEATDPASTDIPGDIMVMDAVQPRRDDWIVTLGDCLASAAGRSDVKADRLGLLGFSLGGHLTLRAAKRQGPNPVRAAVSLSRFYPGQGHGFTGQAELTAETRTVDFFQKQLA